MLLLFYYLRWKIIIKIESNVYINIFRLLLDNKWESFCRKWYIIILLLKLNLKVIDSLREVNIKYLKEFYIKI